MERVPAVLHADVEELIVSEMRAVSLVPRASLSSPPELESTYRQRQQRDILVPGIDKMNDLNGSFSRSVKETVGLALRNLLRFRHSRLTHCLSWS